MSGHTFWLDGRKRVAEESFSLDIGFLNRHGLLGPGRYVEVSWNGADGKPLPPIHFHSGRDREGRDYVRLQYRVPVSGGKWQEFDYYVFLVRTPCNFGGSRLWFGCPSACRNRVRKLFFNGTLFRCRHCNQIGYRSQLQSRLDRSISQIHVIKRRLGMDSPSEYDVPSKPKGMHQRTYQALYLRFARHLAAINRMGDAIAERHDKRRR